MNDDVKDILIELEDEMYLIKYNSCSLSINAPFKFKLKDIKEVLLRLYYYKKELPGNIYIDITTTDRIMGAKQMLGNTAFTYRVGVDTDLFDGFYVERGRGSKNFNPLYIRNNTELKSIYITIV